MTTLLEGKVAIITGSGRGIGAAAAKLFAQHGAHVVVSDLDLEPARAVAQEISAAGGTAITVAGDVTDRDFAQRIVDDTLAQLGGIDIIVNNAGYTWDGVVHTMNDEQWQAMLDVHITAPFRLIRAAAPYLRTTARQEIVDNGVATARKIINVSSVSGVYGNAGQANYAAGKAGIIGLTKTIAKEWGRFNIQCNAVCYGYIATRLTDSKERGETIERDGKEISLGVPEQMIAGMTMLHPLGRGGTPIEAAGPMVFLASALADYVSGAVLEVTGGFAM